MRLSIRRQKSNRSMKGASRRASTIDWIAPSPVPRTAPRP